MKKRVEKLYAEFSRGEVMRALGRVISPLFLVMLLASFTLWYVTKLNYTYTTEFEVEIYVEDQSFKTLCFVEGVGTNLLGYHIYKGGSLRIPLSELRYREVTKDDKRRYIRLDEHSLSNAISLRFSDIKLLSIDRAADLLLSEDIQKVLKNKK